MRRSVNNRANSSNAGSDDDRLEASTLWRLVERRAERTPDALFAIDDAEAALSFAGYRDACLRVAAGLRDSGVREGSAVAWMLPSRLSTLVLIGALCRLGAVQIPIVPIYRHREVRFITRQTGAGLLVVPRRFRGFDYESMARELASERSNLTVLIEDDGLPEGDPPSLPPASPADPSDTRTRWIFYTSGTTADPKGVRHTDESLMIASMSLGRALQIRSDDRIAFVFPVAHVFGPGWLIAGLSAGSAHLVVEQFDPPRTIPFLAKHGVTQAAAGTAFHQAYLAAQRAHPDARLFPDVRAFPGGGAPKPERLHFDLIEEMGGVGIVSGYGMTECPTVSMGSPTDPTDSLARFEGRVVPGVEVRVVGLDGRVRGPNTEGELHVRAPQLFQGYVDASLDAEAFDEEGFFRTGDLGFIDEGGHVAITGRLKEVIIRKGENISAKEIEDLLHDHPEVADVAVIGIPDASVGERVCAIVERTDSERPFTFDEMFEFLLAQQLMMQKIPERLEIVDRIPRNPAGKVRKNELRERFAASRAEGTNAAAKVVREG